MESNCYRLRKAGLRARTVQIKVRYHDFSTVTRAHSLQDSTDATLALWNPVRELLHRLLEKRQFSVRLIGVGLSGFGDSSKTRPQLDLFELQQESVDSSANQSRDKVLDDLSDEIRGKFGKHSLRRGRGI